MVSDIINYTISCEDFQIISTVILGMVAGMTLQPVPKIINKILTEYFLVKLIIIILFTSKILHPVDNTQLVKITIASTLVLVFLDFLRKNENSTK